MSLASIQKLDACMRGLGKKKAILEVEPGKDLRGKIEL
jgi:hypothetical protein